MRTSPMRILVSGCTVTLERLRGNCSDYLGHLLTPTGWNSLPATGLPYAADNGAFSGFDEEAFRLMLTRLADAPQKPMWVTAPDVVGSARQTLELWPAWAMRIRAYGLEPCFVLQDQQTPEKLPDARAFFVGGSTEFKRGPNLFPLLNAIRKRGGCMTHMGRVNTQRRLRLAYDAGVDTVDGTGFSRWGDTRIPLGVRWIKQLQAQGLLRQLDRLGPLEGLLGR